MTAPKAKDTKAEAKRTSVTGQGVEDVTRTVRQVTRTGRDLVTDVGEVLERELAMAISISERLRDEAVSEELLREVRTMRVHAGIRDSAHRAVDLVADAVGVALLTAARFTERLADEPRPALPREQTSEERISA